jgi:ribose 5-phosphate isomerase B
MRIAFGCDHGGLALKKHLIEVAEKAGHEVTDRGTHSTEATDYPDVGHAVAEAVAAGEFDRGVLVCGTGVGMSMSANRHRGIRAVVCSDTFTARFSRLHNDANVLCVGERVLGPGLAEDILAVWIATQFEGHEDRHRRRVAKIEMP